MARNRKGGELVGLVTRTVLVGAIGYGGGMVMGYFDNDLASYLSLISLLLVSIALHVAVICDACLDGRS